MIEFIIGLMIGNISGVMLMAIITAGKIADMLAMMERYYDSKRVSESDSNSECKD